MGLDASVACDCFERGLVRSAPPIAVRVDNDGFLTVAASDPCLADWEALDHWLAHACAHPGQQLAARRLGNISIVSIIRACAVTLVPAVPILRDRVVYSGSHSGDRLELPDILLLGKELDRLERSVAGTPFSREDQELVKGFVADMRTLREAALSVGKPIRF